MVDTVVEALVDALALNVVVVSPRCWSLLSLSLLILSLSSLFSPLSLSSSIVIIALVGIVLAVIDSLL